MACPITPASDRLWCRRLCQDADCNASAGPLRARGGRHRKPYLVLFGHDDAALPANWTRPRAGEAKLGGRRLSVRKPYRRILDFHPDIRRSALWPVHAMRMRVRAAIAFFQRQEVARPRGVCDFSPSAVGVSIVSEERCRRWRGAALVASIRRTGRARVRPARTNRFAERYASLEARSESESPLPARGSREHGADGPVDKRSGRSESRPSEFADQRIPQ